MKRGPYSKTMRKTFSAVIIMRRELTQEALRISHKYPRTVAVALDRAILKRTPVREADVDLLIDQLMELDDIIKDLSRFI
jgi:hypothetical protein